ncbi:MAG: TlpA family protein disulfide reductase [Bacteroidales bacterium]|nr:TlpA family protein disulfide reductase [Bacteroidales bacterium]
MKRIFLLGLAALMAVSCSKSNTAVIDAQIDGADAKQILVTKLSVNQLRFVDTLRTDSKGAVTGKIELTEETPNFYYLSYNGRRLVSLVLKPGDKVKVTADTLGRNVTVEGSQESVLMQKYDMDLAAAVSKFESLSSQLGKAMEAKDAKAEAQLNAELSKLYVKHKQNTIKSIMQNPYAIANVQALYQSIMPGLPVFGGENDHFIFQRVHDSLATLYPESVYVKSLQEQIKAAEDLKLLAGRIEKAEEKSFPNISLPDVNAKNVELASLEGKPFILMFWAVADPNQKMFNNELKEVYNKYKGQGLEIYQVAVDTDKTAWATAVKEQELPWISVCDGKGAASIAVASYNVTAIPSIFVFDRNGDIVASKNLFSKENIEAAVRKAIK